MLTWLKSKPRIEYPAGAPAASPDTTPGAPQAACDFGNRSKGKRRRRPAVGVVAEDCGAGGPEAVPGVPETAAAGRETVAGGPETLVRLAVVFGGLASAGDHLGRRRLRFDRPRAGPRG